MITLITDATRGLGLETARQLAAKGARVILGTRNPEAAEEAVVELRWDGWHAEAIPLDPSSEDSVREAAAEITRRHGRLDLLVNHATLELAQLPAAGNSLQDPADPLESHVSGTRRLMRHFLPLLRHSADGRIVHLSGQAAV